MRGSGGALWARRTADFYAKEARLQQLRSRAAFKLMELDDKFKVFSKRTRQDVLDLGFAPGAWSQVARARTAPQSVILGVDILACDPPAGCSAIQANILSKRTQDLIRLCFSSRFALNTKDKLHPDSGYFDQVTDGSRYPVDIVLSDMYAPSPRSAAKQHYYYNSNITNMPYHRMANTSGIRVRDHLQSIDLCDAALVTAIDLLKPNGSFVCKVFTGLEDRLLVHRFHQVFQKVHIFKPKACRNESKETYLVGLSKLDNINKIKVFT